MCMPPCNDSAASRPKVEVTITTRNAAGETGVAHEEVATRESPQQLATDMAREHQKRAGSDYVRIIDGDR